jgi:hypothetical protein
VPWDEEANHFLDFGVREYGPSPFDALPRDLDRAVQKFGIATVRRNGMLPWRFAEEYGNLQRAFEGLTRNAPYATSDIVFFSAITAHYAQDSTQPFHATDNYDGRATGNDGIHARFERDLIERFESRLRLSPQPMVITDPRTTAFDTLVTGHGLVAQILAADREAAAGKQVYDDDYFEKFFAKVQPVLERQLSLAIAETAGMIIGAWQQAGRPALRLSDVRPPERVRRTP